MKLIKKGEIVKGTVTGIEKYGIFVHVNNDFNGLVHISEISSYFVHDIHDYVSVGETVYCQVIDVDKKSGKLKLSIKNINYKEKNEDGKICETRKGFLPLKENLDRWIQEKLDYYNKSK